MRVRGANPRMRATWFASCNGSAASATLGAGADARAPRRDRMRTALVDAEPEPIAIDPARTALVIIDMQRDFLEPGGFGETLGNDVSLLSAAVGPCRALLERRAPPRHARHPHARRPSPRPVRRAARQGRARRARAAHRRAGADGPHPDPRRAGPRHHPRARTRSRASRSSTSRARARSSRPTCTRSCTTAASRR